MFRRCTSAIPKSTTIVTGAALSNFRFLSTTLPLLTATTTYTSKHIHVETDAKGISVLSFQSPPVNVITTEFMASYNEALESLRTPFSEKNSKNAEQPVTRALILTSALPNTFLAGLDLKQMIDPKLEAYLPFRREIAKNGHLLLHFPTPLLAVITGQCPGQGTVTALACDYRVMVERSSKPGGKPFLVGLNEAAIGLRPPPHAAAAFVDLIHDRNVSYEMLLLGTMATATEAVKLGLINASAPDKETAMAIAMKKAEQYVAISPSVLRDLRQQFITQKYNFLDFQDSKAVEEETKRMHARLCDPQIQSVLKGYVAKLGDKKKK